MIDVEYVLHLETELNELQSKVLDFYKYMDNDRYIYFNCRDVIEAYREKFDIKEDPITGLL